MRTEGAAPDQTRRDIEPSEADWSYERFKREIVKACKEEYFRGGIVEFEKLPQKLDIGKLAEKALECVRATATDGRERASVIRFMPSRERLQMQQNLLTGNEQFTIIAMREARFGELMEAIQRLPSSEQAGYVALAAHISLDPNFNLQREVKENTPLGKMLRVLYPRMVGNIHSHPIELPFSTFDIAVMISDQDHRFMVIGTPSEGIQALVPTFDTTWMSEEEAAEKVQHWNSLMKQRFDRLDKSGMDEHDRLLAERRIQEAMVRTIANKYKLGYYKGGRDGHLERVV